MTNYKEINDSPHNALYYSEMLRAYENEKKTKPSKQGGFASKEVCFSKYLIAPSGYEGLAYTLYFILVPYIVGITFLFFYVARAAYTNFALLDLSSFLIVWAIGYEITAAIILFFIFTLFLKHLRSDKI